MAHNPTAYFLKWEPILLYVLTKWGIILLHQLKLVRITLKYGLTRAWTYRVVAHDPTAMWCIILPLYDVWSYRVWRLNLLLLFS